MLRLAQFLLAFVVLLQVPTTIQGHYIYYLFYSYLEMNILYRITQRQDRFELQRIVSALKKQNKTRHVTLPLNHFQFGQALQIFQKSVTVTNA